MAGKKLEAGQYTKDGLSLQTLQQLDAACTDRFLRAAIRLSALLALTVKDLRALRLEHFPIEGSRVEGVQEGCEIVEDYLDPAEPEGAAPLYTEVLGGSLTSKMKRLSAAAGVTPWVRFCQLRWLTPEVREEFTRYVRAARMAGRV